MSNRDKNFLEMCNVISQNSKCMSRKIGSVLTKENTIISTGYNGPPRDVPHCWQRYYIDFKLIDFLISKGIKQERVAGKFRFPQEITEVCPRTVMGFKSGEGLEWCIAGHAERNALINAARNGISTKDTIMYMNCYIPCTPCLVEIINAGVKEIVVSEMKYYDIGGEFLIKNSSLKVRTYNE